MRAAAVKNLSVTLSEDAWAGDAHATISLDGMVVWQGDVNAAHGVSGMKLDLGGVDMSLQHKLTVQYDNDASGGGAGQNRNLYVNDVLVDGQSQGWSAALYSNGSASRVVGAATGPIAVGAGPDTIEIGIAEDAWKGDAKFVILVDDEQVGDIQTATASAKAGQVQLFHVGATLGSGSHQVTVQFLNDKTGAAPDQDRNLYVRSVSLNGADLGSSAALMTNGDATFRMPGKPQDVSVGTGPDMFLVGVSEDAWMGDAQLAMFVDGVQVGGPIMVTADHASGQVQMVSVHGDFGPGQHQLAVRYVNDAWGGSSTLDRNLYVQSVAYNGEDIGGAHVDLMTAGDGVFFGGEPLPPAPPPAPETAPEPVSGTAPVPEPVQTPVAQPEAQPAAAASVSAPDPGASSPVGPLHAGANADTGLVAVGKYDVAAGVHTVTVGVGKQYATIAAAVNAARAGDVVLIDAGTYTNDFVVNHVAVTLVAVGGRVIMEANVPPPNWKGIITMEADLKVVGITFRGAHIPDEYGHNGAGIRIDTGSLVAENCAFDHNQNGILGGQPGNTAMFDHCLFDQNGGADGNGAGNIHNIYLGALDAVTVTNSVFENAQVGHEFKSRAVMNTLTNNVFISGVGVGTGSYDIDIPNGGQALIENNTIIKGPHAENYNLIHFGGEGIPYAASSLTVTGNTIQSAAPGGYAIVNATPISAVVTGNVFSGLSASVIALGPAKIWGNQDASGQPFGDATLEGLVPGSTLFFTDAAAHAVTLTGQAQAIQGGAGRLTVDVVSGHIQIAGGAGGMDVRESATSGTGGNNYFTKAGTTNSLVLNGVGGGLVQSAGTDTIVTGDGNLSGQVTGSAVITTGKGTAAWSVDGAATFYGSAGSQFITAGASAKLSLRGPGAFWQLTTNGGTLDWDGTQGGAAIRGWANGGAVSSSIYDGVVHLTTAGGGKGVDLAVAQGDAEIKSLGADTIHAGSGVVSVQTSGAAQIYAGTGQLSVFARSNAAGAVLYGAGGTVLIGGDGGNITYYGGDAANTVEAQVQRLTLIGGAGRMTVNGGGRTTIVGGSGGVVFNGQDSGAMTITTAAGSSNTLIAPNDVTLHSFGTDTIVHTQGNATFDVHGDSTLDLANGSMTVDLYGHDTLTAHDEGLNLTVHRGAVVDLKLAGFDIIKAEGGTKVAVAYTDPSGPAGASGAVSFSGGSASLSMWAGQGIKASIGEDRVSSTIQASGKVSIQSHAADTIRITSGTVQLSLDGDGSEVWAGDSTLTVNAGSWGTNHVTLHGGTGRTVVQDDGNVRMKFLGGSGDAVLRGGTLDIVGSTGGISAAADGALSFVGGAGSADLTLSTWGGSVALAAGAAHVRGAGWGNAMLLSFQGPKGGRDVVDNFRLGTDHATLGAGVSVTKQSETGADVRLLLSNGGDVTFTGLAGRGFHLG